MFGKKRKALKRVQAGLEKQTAKLSPDDADFIYRRARRKMAVKKALDKFKIRDEKKRRRIQEIMERLENRRWMLIQTSPVKGTGGIASGHSDLYLRQCMSDLEKELGVPAARRFNNSFAFSKLPLIFRLRPRKGTA